MTPSITFTDSLFWEKTKDYLTCDSSNFINRLEQKLPTFEVTKNEDALQKFYVDFDYKLNKEDYDESIIEIVEQKCQKYIYESLQGYLKIVPNMAMATSHAKDYNETQSKYSVRIFVSNVKATKVSIKKFIIDLNNAVKNKYDGNDNIFDYINETDNLFDISIYDTNRKMRCINTSKPNEKRPLILKTGRIEQTIITSCFDDDFVELNYNSQKEKKYEPEYIRRTEKLDTDYCCENPKVEFYVNRDADATIRDQSYCNKCGKGWGCGYWVIKNPKFISEEQQEQNKKEKSKENKHIDLLFKIGNKGHKRNDWVSICGWCHSNSTKEIFLKLVDDNWKDDAIKMWDTMKCKNVPIYWIETFAKRTNLTVYKEWVEKWNIYYINADDLDDSFKVAKIISNTLKNELILCNEKWFMLTDKQLWKQQKEPSYYIINELRKYIDESNKKIVFQISKAEGETKDKLIEKSKLYLKSYKTISSSGFLNVLTRFLKTLLTDNTFEEKLDNNPNKLAFQNGIMNLETKEFRYGIYAEDYITDTIRYDYTPANLEKKQFVKDVLLKILNNNKEHLEYFLSLIGFSFIGTPHLAKSLYFCVDKTSKSAGDNGKTFFFDILSHLLPNYVYKTDKSFLEDGNKKIHKQLVNMKGKRLVWLDEFNEKKSNAEIMKQIGEGSQVENEILFGTSEIIDIMFKLWTLTNHIPNIDAKETAVYNRYIQVSYGSHFDRTGKRKEENPDKLEFIADINLGDKIKNDYYNEVFEIIIDYANKYYKNKLPSIPIQFENDTKETQMKNDTFGTWFNDNCIIDENERTALKVIMASSGFNEKQIKEGLIRVGFKYDKDLSKMGKDENGKVYKGGFIGFKIKPEETEEE